MPVVAEVRDYLARRYPKPSIDPEWTIAAVAWLQDQLSLNSNTEHASQDLLDNIDLQLLQSDLSDSMLHHSGLPARVQSMKNVVIATPATGGPILVQILEVMEIGVSAFNLMNVRQARRDGTDLSGLAVGTEEEGGEGAKEAKYPRGMLSLTLSDGSVQIKAIEYRKIEGLVLGEIPLGFKLLLKSVRVRNGLALLEPSNVELKGWQSEDMQVNQDQEFVRNLRHRMGKPEVEPNEEGQTHTVTFPTRAVTPPRAAPQPYPASPYPPAQAPRPQHASFATSESKPETRQLTTPPHFTGQALPAVPHPPTSGEDEQYSEGPSFGDMNVDDDVWYQIEDAERAGETGTTLASPQGFGTGLSGASRDVIALDDDDSDEPDDWILGTGRNKEAVSDRHVPRVTPPIIPSTQPRPGHRPTQVHEVIDLSD